MDCKNASLNCTAGKNFQSVFTGALKSTKSNKIFTLENFGNTVLGRALYIRTNQETVSDVCYFFGIP